MGPPCRLSQRLELCIPSVAQSTREPAADPLNGPLYDDLASKWPRKHGAKIPASVCAVLEGEETNPEVAAPDKVLVDGRRGVRSRPRRKEMI